MPMLVYARGVRSWANGGFSPTASGTFTATAVPSTGRVTLNISWTGATYMTVVRVQAGVVYPVRGGYPIGTTGTVVFSDPEAPLDVPVTYRVTSSNFPYQVLESNSVTLASNNVTWLTHPTRPDLSTQLWVERNPNKDRPISRGVFPVLGRHKPIVRTDGMRKASAYTLETVTETYAAYVNMLQLLQDGSPILMRTPGGYPFDSQVWMSVGDVQETTVSSNVTEWMRRWPLPVIEVDPPSIVDAPVVA